MVTLTTNVLGAFALKDGRVMKYLLFPDDPKEIALRLKIVESDLCEEEIQLIEELKGIKEFSVRGAGRFRKHFSDLKFTEEKDAVPAGDIAEQMGIMEPQLRGIIHKSNIELAKIKLRVVEGDQLAMQAISAIDDIDEVINELVERLREWYSIHFPELDDIVANHELYVSLVHELGNRDAFDNLQEKIKIKLHPDMAQKIRNASKDSFGAEFSTPDIDAVKAFAKPILDLYENKAMIEAYIEQLMNKIAPNISALAGPLLGARIISLAGGLKRLSTLPASTIQILGAEDAFFKFLRTKIKPPKHGVIFQLPEIRSAPKKIRGKISRTFAAKLAICAKVDAFGGEFIGDKLRGDFLKRVDGLK